MRRLLDFVLKAAVAAVFVLCIERLARRSRRENQMEKRVPSRQARLRVRRQAHSRRVIFTVEGTLDGFGARMLACSVEQVPASSTAVIDLTEATPIEGEALALLPRIFSAGPRVRFRGRAEDHYGLLTLPLAA